MKKGKDFNEEFYVLKSDDKIRNGTYVKYYSGPFSDIAILESGNYKNGKREGLWEFYYDIPTSISDKNTIANSLRERGFYANDKKNGFWVTFFLDTISNKVSTKRHEGKRKLDSLNISIVQNDLRPKFIGRYLNDKRVGEWTSFDFAGNVYQKHNFTNSKLLFDASITDSLKLNQDRNVIYFGGLNSIIDQLNHKFKFSHVIESIKLDSSSVIAQFMVNANGSISDTKIIQSNSSSQMEKELLRLIALLDNNWVPAMQAGQLVTSYFKIELRIKQRIESKNLKRYNVLFRIILNE